MAEQIPVDDIVQEDTPIKDAAERDDPEPANEEAKQEPEPEVTGVDPTPEELNDAATEKPEPVEEDGTKTDEPEPVVNVEVDTTKSEPEPVANVVPESKGIEPTPPEVETKEDAPPKEAGEDEKVKGKEETKVSGRSKVRSILPSEMVDLAIESNGIASWEPMTIGQMFQESYQKFSDRNALCYKEDEGYKCVTYTQYYTICVNVAKSFIKLGLEKYNAVAIIGFNSPEWFYSNIGAMFAGGLSAGIYSTNGPEACHFVAYDCKANIIVVENQKQLDKILEVRDRLPELKAIVQYKGKLSQEYKDVYDWEQFIELGKDIDDSVVEEKIKEQKPGECALLVYTSGTTGNPKGVMLSHDNLTWTVRALFEHDAPPANWTIGSPGTVVSYLPLSHIAAQMADIYVPLYTGATVYFAQPDALKGTLVNSMKDAKPTLFFGVPRVWEKFKEGVEAAATQVTGLKKKIGAWAANKGLQGNRNIQKKQPVPWGWTIANTLLFKKVKEKFGLQNCLVMHVGAAPIHRDVIEFFMKYNMPILELYGMSECSGPGSTNTIEEWRLGSVGKQMVGSRMKIHNPDEYGEGEVCMYGRHVFMGYLNQSEKTKDTIDDEGWLHSGDIGRIDEDGFIFITGRLKELIITSGGENVAPVPIEDKIKAEIPFISNVMLIGDKRKYLTCLITLKCVMNPDTGEPVDELLPQVAKDIRALGCEMTKPSEIAKEKVESVFKRIQEGLDRANEKAVSRAQKVQKFALLETDFSMPGGELGPTLKLKRRVVVEKYGEVIDNLYV